MLHPNDVATLARQFLNSCDPSDGHALKSLDLILMLLDCSPAPFSRDQFTPGHITTSGLVLSPDGPMFVRGEVGPLRPFIPSGPYL